MMATHNTNSGQTSSIMKSQIYNLTNAQSRSSAKRHSSNRTANKENSHQAVSSRTSPRRPPVHPTT